MRILLDFEGTLCSDLSRPPPDAAVAVVTRLKADDRHKIPYDEILTFKPRCDVVIDSRALPFDGSWAKLAKRLRQSGV